MNVGVQAGGRAGGDVGSTCSIQDPGVSSPQAGLAETEDPQFPQSYYVQRDLAIAI